MRLLTLSQVVIKTGVDVKSCFTAPHVIQLKKKRTSEKDGEKVKSE